MPSFPVDSAMSCSAQSANPTMYVPSGTRPSLSRRRSVPAIAAASTSAGFSGLVDRDAAGDGRRLVEQLWMSTPARPDGTRPNAVSAEYRPPTFGSALNTR